MTFTSSWNISYAIQLSPGICDRVIAPNIIEPLETICATESGGLLELYLVPRRFWNLQIKPVIPCYNGMVSSRWWDTSISRHLIVLDQHLPAIGRYLKLVEVKRNQIIHKVALHLATKYVNFRSEDIQGMPISSSRPWTSRHSSRPLTCCCAW